MSCIMTIFFLFYVNYRYYLRIFLPNSYQRKILKTDIRIICIIRDRSKLYGYFFILKGFQKDILICILNVL